jgi:5'-3' exonuclease-like protein
VRRRGGELLCRRPAVRIRRVARERYCLSERAFALADKLGDLDLLEIGLAGPGALALDVAADRARVRIRSRRQPVVSIQGLLGEAGVQWRANTIDSRAYVAADVIVAASGIQGAEQAIQVLSDQIGASMQALQVVVVARRSDVDATGPQGGNYTRPGFVLLLGSLFLPSSGEHHAKLPHLLFHSGTERVCGFANAKTPGYEADDFLAAAVAREERRKGTVIVATGDRDAFQLVSEQTTILQPIKAGEMARIGPAEVRKRYGVEPSQVPDFIALRSDASDRIPGAKGVGPKGAAALLRQYKSLDALLTAGRFPVQAEELRLYRSIATMDRSAPLPALRNQAPTWESASALAREWDLNRLADRLAELARQ